MKVIKRDLGAYEKLELYVLADLHKGDKLSDKRKFEKWKDEVLAADNRFIILNGDLLNNAIANSKSDIYGEDNTPNNALNSLVDELKPLKDRILSITNGNHENRTYRLTSIDLMQRLARELDIEECYSEGAYLLYISFGKSQGRDCRKMIYSIYGKHGSQGGRKAGSKLNHVVEMSEIIDADIYLHSHTHVPIVSKDVFYRCDYRNRKVTEITHTYVNTNAFLGYGGYGENGGYKPGSTDYPKIILDGIERGVQVLL